MLLEDFKLLESITFGVTTTEPHPEYGEVHTSVGKNEKIPCHICNGTGKDRLWIDDEGNYIRDDQVKKLSDEERSKLTKQDCGMCDGTGEYEDFISDGPEMSLANRNAGVLIELLGREFDYAGTIFNEELPALRRHIIKVLNSDDISNAVISPSEKGGEVKRDAIKRDDGVTQIGSRKTAKMMDLGLHEDQIKRYFKEILEMIDYAQKNGYNIGWS